MVSVAARGYTLKRGLKDMPIKNTILQQTKITRIQATVYIKQSIYKGFTTTFF